MVNRCSPNASSGQSQHKTGLHTVGTDIIPWQPRGAHRLAGTLGAVGYGGRWPYLILDNERLRQADITFLASLGYEMRLAMAAPTCNPGNERWRQ